MTGVFGKKDGGLWKRRRGSLKKKTEVFRKNDDRLLEKKRADAFDARSSG